LTRRGGGSDSEVGSRSRAGDRGAESSIGHNPTTMAAEAAVIYETVHGSRAHGLATETSDTDLRGVFVPPPLAFTGFVAQPDQIEPAEVSEFRARGFGGREPPASQRRPNSLRAPRIDPQVLSPGRGVQPDRDRGAIHGSPGSRDRRRRGPAARSTSALAGWRPSSGARCPCFV